MNVKLREKKEFEQNMIVSRREFEQKVRKDGICSKPVSQGNNGMPNRMVLLPAGRISQSSRAEVKEIRHSQLRILGAGVFILDYPVRV